MSLQGPSIIRSVGAETRLPMDLWPLSILRRVYTTVIGLVPEIRRNHVVAQAHISTFITTLADIHLAQTASLPVQLPPAVAVPQ